MIKNKPIDIPHYIRKGIKLSRKKASKYFIVLSGDTETNLKGEPVLLTLREHNGGSYCFDVDKYDCENKFIDWLYKHSFEGGHKTHATNVIFFHNLLFDLSAIFSMRHAYFGHKEFIITGSNERYSYAMEIKSNKSTFGTLYFFKAGFNVNSLSLDWKAKSSKCIFLRDSFQFYNFNLGKVARDLHLNQLKDKHPKLLGHIKDSLYEYSKDDVQEFKHYAIQDVKTEDALASHIIDSHIKLDIPLCVSIAQMSARNFKHNFLKKEDLLTFPDANSREIAQLSYHGGKNGFYLDKPQLIEDVYEIDVNSMYPFAMVNIPNFNHCEYYHVDDFKDKFEGVYRISGFVHESKYKIIPKHEFGQKENYYSDTYIEDVCITSYELRQALEDKLIDLDRIEGSIILEEKGVSNPIKDYIDYFYKLKCNTPKEDSNYQFYKLNLNSLYGKFQQLTECYTAHARNEILCSFGVIPQAVSNVDLDTGICTSPPTYWLAGGLYNPMISTLITGFARKYLYQLEVEYNAFDSSTDSVKTVLTPKNINKNLGGVDVKNFGDCIFIRNKLYLHFDDDDKISSYALHGFQGDANQLFELWKTKTNVYTHMHMNKVREALITDKIPLVFEEREKRLNIEW